MGVGAGAGELWIKGKQRTLNIELSYGHVVQTGGALSDP